MAGKDPNDPITNDFHHFDFNFSLSASWKDFRIGFADRSWYWEPLDSEHPEAEQKMIALISDKVAQIKALGAEVIENVPFSSAAESRHQSLDIYWEIIRSSNQFYPDQNKLGREQLID
ncbi:amidase family protein [Penicillium malachiteum]|nr:amidase family protein [Penicillium malachiteum]